MPSHPCRSGRDRDFRRGLLAALAASLCMLSGCAVLRADDPVPDEPDLPAAWSAGAPAVGAAARPDWWQHFDDPLLWQLVADALQANTGVRAAQAALRQARALSDVAGAALQPRLDGSGSAQRGWRGGQDTGERFQLGLDAGWEPDLFGARRSALATSQASARANAASLGAVQVSLAAEVAVDYIALRGAQARLAIAQANLDSQLHTLQLTDWRVQAGLLSTLEAEQARAAVAQLRAALPALHTRIAQSSHALSVLTGRPPATLSALLATPAPVPQAPGDLALSLPAETLRQRPDVRAAEQQVLAAQGRVAQADAARYPSFSLGGSLGLDALTLGGLGGSAAVVGSLLARVSLPLWDGGAGRARVSAEQAALDQARATYRGTVLSALLEVEDALVALHADRERVARLQQAAAAATAAATLARQRYASGLVDFQTVLETQRNQLGAQDGLAVADADLGTDHVRLFKALGGAWRPDGDAAAGLATPATASDLRTR